LEPGTSGETTEFKAFLDGSMEGLRLQTGAHQGTWHWGKEASLTADVNRQPRFSSDFINSALQSSCLVSIQNFRLSERLLWLRFERTAVRDFISGSG